MSSPIEERIIKLTLQYGSMASGAEKAKGLLDRITDSVKKLSSTDASAAAKGIDAISSSSSDAVGGMNELSDAAMQTSGKFSALKAMATGALLNIGAMASQQALGLIKSFTLDPIIGGFNEYELKLKSMQTIMTNTGESVGVVNAALDDLNGYSDRTIYNFNDMTTAIGSLSTSGMKLGDSMSVVKGFFNLAAGTGIEASRASSLLDTALVQAIQLGKMDYQNWKQIQQAGMGGPKFQNALIKNAQAMGKQIDLSEGFNESLRQGWATTDVMLATMKEFENDESLLDAATRVKSLTQLIDTLGEAVGSGWAQSWEIVFGNFEEATVLWTTVSKAIEPIITKTTDMRNNFLLAFKAANGFNAIGGIFVGIARIIGNIAKAIGDAFNSVGILGQGFKSLGAAVAFPFKMVEYFVRKISELTIIPKTIGFAFKVLFTLLSPVMKLLIGSGNTASTVWGLFTQVVDRLVIIFNKLTDVVFKVLDAILNGITKVISKIASITIEPIVTTLRNLATTTLTVLVNSFLKILDIIGAIGKAIKNAFTTKSFTPIKQAISELGRLFKELFKIIFNLQWVHAFDPLKNAIVEVGKDLLNLAKKFTVVGDLFKKAFGLIGAGLSKLQIPETVGRSLNTVSRLYGKLQETMLNKFGVNIDIKFQANRLKDAITQMSAFKLISGYVDTAKESINDFADTVAARLVPVANAFRSLRDIIKESFDSRSFTPIINSVKSLGSTMKASFDKIDFSFIGEGLVKGLVGLHEMSKKINLQPLYDGLGKVSRFATQAFKDVDFSVVARQFDKLKTAISGINFDSVGVAFNSIGTTVKNAFSGVDFTSVGAAFSTIGDTIKNSFSGIDFSPLQGKLELLKSGFEIAFNAIASAAKKVSSIPVFDYLQNGIQKVIDVIGGFNFWTVADATSNGVNATIKSIGSLNNKTKESESTFSRAMKKIVDVVKIAVQYTVEGLGMMAVGIGAAFKGIGTVLKGIIDSLKDFVPKLKEALGDKLSTENLVKGGIFVYLGLMLKNIASFKSKAGSMMDSIGGFFDGFGKIGGIFDKITDALANFNKTVTPGNILKVGAAVGILALSLKLLSTIDTDKIVTSLAAIAGSLGGVVGSMVALEKFGGNPAKVAASGAAMFSVGVALLAMAGAIKILSTIDPGAMFTAIAAIGLLVAGMSAALIAVSRLGKSTSISITGMVGMAIAITILAGAVKKFADIPMPDLLKGGAAVIVMIGALAVAMKVMGTVKFALGTGLAVVAIANAIVVLADAVKIMGAIDTGSLVQGMVSVGLMLAGLTLSLKVLSTSTGSALGAGVAIMAVALALKMLVGPVKTLGSLNLATLAKGLGSMGIMLGGITLALSVLAGNTGGNLAAAGSIALVAAALTLLIIPITILGTMKWQTLVQGLIAMAAALGLIIAAGYLATGASVGLLAIAGAMGALALAAISIAAALTATVIILEFFTSTSKEAFTTLVDNIILFINKLGETIPAVINFVNQMIDGFINVIITNAPKFIEMGLFLITSFLQGVAESLPAIIEAVTTIIVAFLDGLAEGLPRIIDSAFNLILQFINGLTSAVTEYGPQINTAIQELLMAIINVVIQAIVPMAQAAGAFIGGFISSAVAWAGRIWGSISNFFTSLPGKIVSAIGSLVNKAMTWIEGFTSGAVSSASRIWGSISGFFTSIPGKISGAIGNLYDSGASIMNGFKDGLMSGIEDAKNAVANGVKAIRDFFPFSPAKKGAFSGKGWVLYSGRSVMDAMAQGIKDRSGQAKTEAQKAMGLIHDELNNELKVEPTFDMTSVKMKDLSRATELFTNTNIQGTTTFETKLLDRFNTLSSDMSEAFDKSISKLNNRMVVVENYMDSRLMGDALAAPVSLAQSRSDMFKNKFIGKGM